MDANELGRWTRFAAKGGIGKCLAVQDCVAEEEEDLMFLKVRARLYMLLRLHSNGVSPAAGLCRTMKS